MPSIWHTVHKCLACGELGRDIISSDGERQSRETSTKICTDAGFSDIKAATVKMFNNTLRQINVGEGAQHMTGRYM